MADLAARNLAVAEEIGSRLMEERERQNLFRTTLAERSGVHYDTLVKVETGRRGITLDTLAKVATGLGLDLWTLVQPNV